MHDEPADVPPDDALRQRAKAVMRRRARAVRTSVPSAALAVRSARIVARVLEHPAIATASRVASFSAIRDKHEVDLAALHAALRAQRKQVYYPAIEPQDGGRMRFGLVVDLAELCERGHGFAEPSPDAPRATALDVIVVPGLLFDARGHRIGYGAGYYDRTLPAFCPPALSLGVAFDFQLASEIPNTQGDVAVAVIVTDARSFAAAHDDELAQRET